MQTRPVNRTILPRFGAVAGLVIFLSVNPVQAFRGSGPGTTSAGIPQPFSIQDFDSVRRNNFPFPTTMSPGVLHALGGCVDPEGNPPNIPVEYDLSIEIDRTGSPPLIAGVSPCVCISLRSSSSRWFETPPDVELLFVGSADSFWMDIGHPVTAQDGTSNTLLVGEFSSGPYRIHAFERTTGLCVASDFTVEIEGIEPEETPTPTATRDTAPTETPTRIPTPIGPTPTPTLRMPDYDDNRFVNGADISGYLIRLMMMSQEANLDSQGELDHRDVFMLTLWWYSDRLRN